MTSLRSALRDNIIAAVRATTRDRRSIATAPRFCILADPGRSCPRPAHIRSAFDRCIALLCKSCVTHQFKYIVGLPIVDNGFFNQHNVVENLVHTPLI
jgi:hypothetical protein